MSVKYPAAFEDSTGTIDRLTGELELFTIATQREQLQGNATAVGNGATGALTWNTKVSGSTLLDISTPAEPTPLAAGVYAVAVTVTPATITVGGYYTVSLALDSGGEDATVEVTSPASIAANQTPIVSAALTYFVPVGGTIDVTVANEDGASSVDFTLSLAVVQAI